MRALDIELIPCLSDSYAFLVHDPAQGQTAAVDTPDAKAILKRLDEKGWKLTHILNTHHHHDHVGGNRAIKQATGCAIYGSAADRDRIPGVDQVFADGDSFMFGAHEVTVFDTPAHTRGHISYWFADALTLFPGDTLFAMGCGRLFEGTPAQMWTAMKRFAALPPQTRVYCAHEYTLSNARFAAGIEPDNAALQSRLKQVEAMRADGVPTIPTTIGEERETNPFMRADTDGVRRGVNLDGVGPIEVLAEVRRRKDAA